MGNRAQLIWPLRPEQGWKPNWDQTLPLRPVEASLVSEVIYRRSSQEQKRQKSDVTDVEMEYERISLISVFYE